ncbi:hypothetical protein LTR27_010759 [Elasticomyces elasticus]|nr:hypothetical protein LTR27_010759 [Elasticomyces elasticus]
MFCTTLRRRASFSSAIPSLTASTGVNLRESRLNTHDVAIPLGPNVDPTTGAAVATRCMRYLLLAPSSMDKAKIDTTLDRIQHFASLTGGHDLAIIFLLQTPPSTSFAPARELMGIASSSTSPATSGMYAYTSLQAILVDRSDIPYIPILPLANLEGLSNLLHRHSSSTARPLQIKAPLKPPGPLDMLKLCTSNPPMVQHTAYVLSDLFDNLHDLAETCTDVSSPPASSSPSARAAAGCTSSQDTEMLDAHVPDVGGYGKLKRLRDLIGEQQCAELIDFWRDEWTVE